MYRYIVATILGNDFLPGGIVGIGPKGIHVMVEKHEYFRVQPEEWNRLCSLQDELFLCEGQKRGLS